MADEKNQKKKKKHIDLEAFIGKRVEVVSKIFADENGKPRETHFIGILAKKELEYLRLTNARVFITSPFDPNNPDEIKEVGRFPSIAIRKEIVGYLAEIG